MKREIILGGKKVIYIVKPSRRGRYLRMTIGADGVVAVTIPHPSLERFVEKFLRQKSKWILKHLDQVKKLEGKTVIKHSKRDYEKNKDLVLKMVSERIQFFNTFYKLPYHRISIRNQTSLWGSCTRAGNLQFNYKLMYLPKRSFDYVVVHELCHLQEHNHSGRFWKLVARMIPDYKAIRKSLHKYVMQEG
jgi:predicted metal-dependent hydrolase